MINKAPALRAGDVGIHTTCCGSNTWKITHGSGGVFINGKPMVREGDPTKHCGGKGKMEGASGNVFDGSDMMELRDQISEWLDRVQSDGLQDLLALMNYPLAAAYYPFDEASKLTDPDCHGMSYFQHLAKCLPGSPPDPPEGPRPPHDPGAEPVGFFDLDNPITDLALLPVGAVRGIGVAAEGGGALVEGGGRLLVKGGGALIKGGGDLVSGAVGDLGSGLGKLGGLAGAL